MNTYFALRRGLAYEGDGSFYRAIHPTPVMTRAFCAGLKAELHSNNFKSPLFREDLFDPVTRIRRGRLYRLANSTVNHVRAENVHNYPYGPHVGAADLEWMPERLYVPVSESDLLSPDKLDGMQVDLGESPMTTPWRVVAIERVSSGELLFTLRTISSLGALPVLVERPTSLDGSSADVGVIQQALDHLVTAFHAQQATPIVDVARETAKVLLTTWIGPSAYGKDLGKVIDTIPEDRQLTRSAASLVNRLHPRGKSSEREHRAALGTTLRPLVDEDAETSVHLVGLILRELEWASST